MLVHAGPISVFQNIIFQFNMYTTVNIIFIEFSLSVQSPQGIFFSFSTSYYPSYLSSSFPFSKSYIFKGLLTDALIRGQPYSQLPW